MYVITINSEDTEFDEKATKQGVLEFARNHKEFFPEADIKVYKVINNKKYEVKW